MEARFSDLEARLRSLEPASLALVRHLPLAAAKTPSLAPLAVPRLVRAAGSPERLGDFPEGA